MVKKGEVQFNFRMLALLNNTFRYMCRQQKLLFFIYHFYFNLGHFQARSTYLDIQASKSVS